MNCAVLISYSGSLGQHTVILYLPGRAAERLSSVYNGEASWQLDETLQDT